MRASAKATAAPNTENATCYIGIDIGINYEDNTTDWSYVPFNPDVSDWQTTSFTAVPEKGNENKKIKYITIYLLYYNQVNTAYFDDIMVTIDETGTTYSYDSKGNMISSADNARRQTTYTMDNATNMVTSVKDSTDTIYSYIYDTVNKKQIRSAKEASTGIGFEYSYGTGNNKGNVTKVQMGKVGSMSSGKYIESGTEYTANGAYATAELDQRGNRTSYAVDEISGQVNSVTDPLNHKTEYTYDPVTKNLTKAAGGQAVVSYGYDTAVFGNRLKSITNSGTTYNFVYDKWNHVQSVNIGGSQTLITNSYADGNLLKSVYGNGQTREYVYDIHDRIIAEKSGSQDSQPVFQTAAYAYNAEGQLARAEDKVNGHTVTYSYDLSGRITECTNGLGRVAYGYDNLDRTGKVTTEFNGKTHTTEYAYLSANRPGVTLLPAGKTDRVYDALQRESVHQVYADKASSRHLRSEITFLDLAGNRTTDLVAGYDQYAGTGTSDKTAVAGYNSFRYTYDANGNITKITEKDGTKSRSRIYEYDSLNQLVRENDEVQNKTITYAYDNGGNLLRRTEYAYTAGGLGTPQRTIAYGYGDSTWKDKLTSYNGQKITYDGVGNPLTYRDGMQFTWRQGRQLAGTTLSNGTKVTYSYNTEGLRIGKTAGGTETTYFTDPSGRMQALKQGKEELVFMYDATGRREGFIWYSGDVKKGAYYYLYNAQSDVIGIVAEDLTPVVRYEYDSWGKQLKVSGAQADTVGKLNPFRYRGYVYDDETGFYYVSSRYYDPEIGRFINADGYVSIGQGILGNNMFAYCGNNPVNNCDPSGQFFISALLVGGLIIGSGLLLSGCSAKPELKPEPYKSADDAARAFSEQVYSSSSYIRHEYSTEIYSRTVKGETTYNYNPPRAGKPHSASVGNSTPKGTKAVAYAHTHPNSNVFSGADIRAAESLKIDAYVVGPNLKLQRYSLSSASTTNLGVISPIALTDAQRSSLVTEFQVSWDTHISSGCDFDCGSMTWPTP